MKNLEIMEKLEGLKTRSKWDQGVKEYALELLENLNNNEEITEEKLLNGARDWKEYSWGGCSLIYDGDICERLATPSEQKRTRNGELRPNSQEEWLDVQARALYQAAIKIRRISKGIF